MSECIGFIHRFANRVKGRLPLSGPFAQVDTTAIHRIPSGQIPTSVGVETETNEVVYAHKISLCSEFALGCCFCARDAVLVRGTARRADGPSMDSGQRRTVAMVERRRLGAQGGGFAAGSGAQSLARQMAGTHSQSRAIGRRCHGALPDRFQEDRLSRYVRGARRYTGYTRGDLGAFATVIFRPLQKR